MPRFLSLLTVSLDFFIFLTFLVDCRTSELLNPCDPNGKALSESLILREALRDQSPICGLSIRNLVTTPSYTISGTISGLLSSDLVLQNNGSEEQVISYAATSFSFPTKVTDYLVTVKSQPRYYTCTVANGSGRASSDVTNVTVSCSPKQAGYLLVSNVTSQNISVYSINPSTGVLTQIAGSPFSTGTCAPRGLSLSPDSNFVYAACQVENKIRVYSVSKSDGSLTQISGSPFSVPSGSPTRLAMDPAGKWLVVGTNNPSSTIHMYSVNTSSGEPTFLASYTSSGAQPYAVTFDATGKFVYAGIGAGANTGNVDGWTVNSSTGALTSVGASVAGGSNAIEITTDPASRYLYAANYLAPGRVFVYTINSTSGVLAQIAGLGAGYSTVDNSPDSLLVDPKNRFVYVGNQSGSLAGFTIDSSTGGLTAMSGSPFAGFTGALAMEPSGTYLYSGTGGNVRTFSVNSSTGVPAQIGGAITAGTDQTSLVIASY
ncbi:MAG: beta-propeller fold lactonase family protein [Leptospira sp.]|nr:beta-propeller fold lactonase family protein [Leptospira sp.]